MKKYNLTVTRVSGYTVDAETAEEAVDLVLGGEVEENGEETVEHTVEESNEPPDETPVPEPFEGEVLDLKDGDLRVVFENIGEGFWGDYNPNNPADRRLLRFTVYKTVNGQEEQMDDASYCTLVYFDEDRKLLREYLELIMKRVKSALDAGESVRRACEELSWLGKLPRGAREERLAKLRRNLELTYDCFENSVMVDLKAAGISQDDAEDIVTRLLEEADMETLVKVASESF
jgi:hypothetical protein